MAQIPEPKSISAWTDGATSGNPGPSGWAVLMNGKLYAGSLPRATNNEAELHAAFQAALLCPKDSQLTIVTDSQLLIGWLTGRFKVNHRHIAEAIAHFHSAARFNNLAVAFRKTKGHAKDPRNIRVDKAARAASLREKAAQADGDTEFGKLLIQ